ncbi:MAG: (mRNA) endoribonuclease [Pseudomonadota bacterium]|jgi:2-iminobutanoate/2-iminopropanoate deaminase
MKPEVIATDKAPKAVGAYAQAVRANGLVFLSGQIPLDPATGELIQGDVAAQTRRVLDNLKAVLEGAGTALDRVVKATIYLTDMADFAVVNQTYAEYFPAAKPARATVAVAGLPRGSKVEIDMIALA